MKTFPLSRIFLTLLTIIIMIIMVKLGFWQLDREKEKLQRQQLYNQRIQEPIRPLPSELERAQDWYYSRVTVNAQFVAESGFLVDNIVNAGQVGANVVTPAKIEGSEQLVLVNRGWLAWGSDRTFLPTTLTPQGPLQLTGVIVPASDKHFYLKDPDSVQEKKSLWLQLDVERFRKHSNSPVHPFILVLDAGQPGSYAHIWGLAQDNWVQRHKAYAVQWFALTASLFIIYCFLSYRYWINPTTRKEKE